MTKVLLWGRKRKDKSKKQRGKWTGFLELRKSGRYQRASPRLVVSSPDETRWICSGRDGKGGQRCDQWSSEQLLKCETTVFQNWQLFDFLFLAGRSVFFAFISAERVCWFVVSQCESVMITSVAWLFAAILGVMLDIAGKSKHLRVRSATLVPVL
jgi:hypothetical protein